MELGLLDHPLENEKEREKEVQFIQARKKHRQ